MVKDLLLQILMIVLPILSIQLTLLRRRHTSLTRRHLAYIGMISGLSAVLCMTFPIQFREGFIWDFRWIPLTFAILYGGVPAGLAGIVVALLYRLWIGGPAMYFALVGNVLTVIVPFLLASRFRERPWPQRIAVSLGVSLLAFVYGLVNMAFFLAYVDKLATMKHHVWLFITAGALQLVLTALCAFIIENSLEIAKLRSGMMRSEQLMTVSELAASVTHEVRNPLTVVRGFLQLAKSSVDPKINGYMDTAIAELDRAEYIISDYLSLAKPQVERLETIDVKEKLAGIVSLMNSFATLRGVALRIDIQIGLAIRADSAKLGQVVMNLIKNAVEAVDSNVGEVRIASYLRKGQVVIEVSDNGEGMTPEQLKRLGTTYYTTKENGTGLGTMVAFRIIEAMGGKLEYESVRGEGTTAYITLPAAANGT